MIDLTPSRNPARYPALHAAANRATREARGMAVYVKAEASPWNRWFVRPVGDAAPEGAELFQVVAPGSETFSQH